MKRPLFLTFGALLTAAVYFSLAQPEPTVEGHPQQDSLKNQSEQILPSLVFLKAIGAFGNPSEKPSALTWIESNWSDQLLPYFIEVRRFSRSQANHQELAQLLKEKTNLEWADFDAISRYAWEREIVNTPDYALFKQLFHIQIDPKFETYFEPQRRFDIRLDEISWGGVLQDGIPPLRNPKMLAVENADYLEDSNIVFGIEINGDARAYPKRILAWHEMLVDTVGGIPLAGVYCTLCGTVIIYHTEFDGTVHALGTSGFLYRSNKLMYDHATQSLWSTLEGRPVVGPLLGKGIELKQSSVVTTTWGEWKKRHPQTQVLSLDTGHKRDYGEGVAYQSYFATDDRMFETPYRDERLKNKDEVLALRFVRHDAAPIVISTNFLKENPLYESIYDGRSFVVLTDTSGANRVYERPTNLNFKEWDQNDTLKDSKGHAWKLTESSLTSESGKILQRLPAHRAFWFGWHGAFPETILVK